MQMLAMSSVNLCVIHYSFVLNYFPYIINRPFFIADQKIVKRGISLAADMDVVNLCISNLASTTHLLTPAEFNMHSNARCLLRKREGKVLDSTNNN